MAPASIVIDIVFIPVYALLSIGSVVNACKHRRSGGFIQLLLFALFRFVGTILLVYAYYSKTTDKNVYIAGGLFTGLGYSFLLVSISRQCIIKAHVFLQLAHHAYALADCRAFAIPTCIV